MYVWSQNGYIIIWMYAVKLEDDIPPLIFLAVCLAQLISASALYKGFRQDCRASGDNVILHFVGSIILQ